MDLSYSPLLPLTKERVEITTSTLKLWGSQEGWCNHARDLAHLDQAQANAKIAVEAPIAILAGALLAHVWDRRTDFARIPRSSIISPAALRISHYVAIAFSVGSLVYFFFPKRVSGLIVKHLLRKYSTSYEEVNNSIRCLQIAHNVLWDAYNIKARFICEAVQPKLDSFSADQSDTAKWHVNTCATAYDDDTLMPEEKHLLPQDYYARHAPLRQTAVTFLQEIEKVKPIRLKGDGFDLAYEVCSLARQFVYGKAAAGANPADPYVKITPKEEGGIHIEPWQHDYRLQAYPETP